MTPVATRSGKGAGQAKVIAIVPAAGIGSRMGAAIPKQYLPLQGKTILGHTLACLLSHKDIDRVVVALATDDCWFEQLPESHHPKLVRALGGHERADSVLSALESIADAEDTWALVHDAARPCLSHEDIDALLRSRQCFPQGAILAMPVRDTMKRAGRDGAIDTTVCRDALWHALTPQLFPAFLLKESLHRALSAGVKVTDEASAMEWVGVRPGLIGGRADNIKITHPDDLHLAGLILMARQQAAKEIE